MTETLRESRSFRRLQDYNNPQFEWENDLTERKKETKERTLAPVATVVELHGKTLVTGLQ